MDYVGFYVFNSAVSAAPDGYVIDATYSIVLGIIAVILVGPYLIPIIIFVVVSCIRASTAVLERALKIIIDKLFESLLVAILLWLAGVPALTFLSRVFLSLFNN